MCLTGGPGVEKKTQCTESPAALSALHHAAGMGNHCGGEWMNCLALWAAGKHQVCIAKIQASETLTLVDLFFIDFLSVRCQQAITLEVCLEAGADPVFSFTDCQQSLFILDMPGI